MREIHSGFLALEVRLKACQLKMKDPIHLIEVDLAARFTFKTKSIQLVNRLNLK